MKSDECSGDNILLSVSRLLDLENKEVKRVNDLISRQKTIKTIYYYFEDLIKTLPKIVNSDGKKIVDISKTDEYLKIDKAIRELITILPSEKPRGGEWIFLDECSNSGYYCSRCRKKLVKEGWSNTVKKINYCPNCGASMRKDKEN